MSFHVQVYMCVLSYKFKESTHFDVCLVKRVQRITVLRYTSVTPLVWTTTRSLRDFTSGHLPMGNVDMVVQEQHGRFHSEEPKKLGTEWSAEEAEVAAQDRSVWKYLSSHAACAELHKADW